MIYFRLESRSTVTLPNHSELRRFWKSLDPIAQMLICEVIVTRPLTVNQKSRLPQLLRAKLA